MSISRDSWRRIQHEERAALLATIEHVDPGAPTLCDGWTASSVAAHLVVSEAARGWPLALSYPLRRAVGARATRAALEAMAGPFQRLTDRTQRRGWPVLLDRLSQGPPAVYSLPWLAKIRLLEAWIHHEDVRRASVPTPRPRTAEVDEALVEAMTTVIRMPEFAVPRAGVQVVLPDGRHYETGGDVRVRVSGAPGEVLLWAAGRGAAAEVDVEGDPSTVEQLSGQLRF